MKRLFFEVLDGRLISGGLHRDKRSLYALAAALVVEQAGRLRTAAGDVTGRLQLGLLGLSCQAVAAVDVIYTAVCNAVHAHSMRTLDVK